MIQLYENTIDKVYAFNDHYDHTNELNPNWSKYQPYTRHIILTVDE